LAESLRKKVGTPPESVEVSSGFEAGHPNVSAHWADKARDCIIHRCEQAGFFTGIVRISLISFGNIGCNFLANFS